MRTEWKQQAAAPCGEPPSPAPEESGIQSTSVRVIHEGSWSESTEAHVLQADRAGMEPRVASAATSAAIAHGWGALGPSHSSCWYLSRAGLMTVTPGV